MQIGFSPTALSLQSVRTLAGGVLLATYRVSADAHDAAPPDPNAREALTHRDVPRVLAGHQHTLCRSGAAAEPGATRWWPDLELPSAVGDSISHDGVAV